MKRVTQWRLVLSLVLVPSQGWSFCGHNNHPPILFAASLRSSRRESQLPFLSSDHHNPLRPAARDYREHEKPSHGRQGHYVASGVYSSPPSATNDDVDAKSLGTAHASSSASPSPAFQVPTVRRILGFAIPAIGVWLCSPLLSMIDTGVVGLFSGTVQQAALNPAVSVTDYSARVLSFLYAGTTNLVATSQQRDLTHESTSATERTVVGALRLAFLVGSGLGLVLLAGATRLTGSLIGNADLDPEVARAAARYVRIRALGMPAAALIGTAQAACLGLKDVKSPLAVIGVAALVNLVSDLLLVGSSHPWIGGAAGAAWATAFSQYFAVTLFLRWLTTKPKPVAPAENELEDLWSSRLMTLPRLLRFRRSQSSESFSTRGLLKGHLDRRTFFQKPGNETLHGYKPYVVPVTTTQVGRCSTYIAMGHVVSSSFGTVSMAANQVITSIFYSLIPVADSLSLTMQSFLPGIVVGEPSPERSRALRATTLNLYKCAGIFGAGLAAMVSCIPLLSGLFTKDPAVATLVASIVPILFVIFSLHGVFCGSEGILLGQRDLKFLGRMYAVYFCVVPYLMLRIKTHAAIAATTQASAAAVKAPSLRSVWSLFLAYQMFRISVWVGRVAWLQRQEEKQVTNASS